LPLFLKHRPELPGSFLFLLFIALLHESPHCCKRASYEDLWLFPFPLWKFLRFSRHPRTGAIAGSACPNMLPFSMFQEGGVPPILFPPSSFFTFFFFLLGSAWCPHGSPHFIDRTVKGVFWPFLWSIILFHPSPLWNEAPPLSSL